MLFQIATTFRAAIKNAFKNGQAKMLTSTIIQVIRHFCLCHDHNLGLSV